MEPPPKPRQKRAGKSVPDRYPGDIANNGHDAFPGADVARHRGALGMKPQHVDVIRQVNAKSWRDHKGGPALLTVKIIAADTGWSPKTIERAIRDLAACGWLEHTNCGTDAKKQPLPSRFDISGFWAALDRKMRGEKVAPLVPCKRDDLAKLRAQEAEQKKKLSPLTVSPRDERASVPGTNTKEPYGAKELVPQSVSTSSRHP